MTLEHTLGRDELATSLARLERASPALLESRGLLRRADTKFLAVPGAIPALVDRVAVSYAVVPVGDAHVASYANLYFDTPTLQCFHDHRRGRRVRHKIRIRHYVDRTLSFLEVKTRRNELRTDKARLGVPYGTRTLDREMVQFVLSRCAFADVLVPAVAIDYRRLMLVGLGSNERVTIDLGLAIDDDFGLALGAVAIVEVKQPARSLTTPIMLALRAAGMKPCSLSKYATALAARMPARGGRLRPACRQLDRAAVR